MPMMAWGKMDINNAMCCTCQSLGELENCARIIPYKFASLGRLEYGTLASVDLTTSFLFSDREIHKNAEQCYNNESTWWNYILKGDVLAVMQDAWGGKTCRRNINHLYKKRNWSINSSAALTSYSVWSTQISTSVRLFLNLLRNPWTELISRVMLCICRPT